MILKILNYRSYLAFFCSIFFLLSYNFLGDVMKFKIGDLVTRNSHGNDIIFKIISIDGNEADLKGVNVRLLAHSEIADLNAYNNEDIEHEEVFLKRIAEPANLNRNDYFYIPGKILHIDSDSDYLSRCLDYYDKSNVWSMGINEEEDKIADNIKSWLDKYKPNIVVITGHDAYYKRKGAINDINAYKNSTYFVNAIKKAREFEDSHEKLIIIAGGCSSCYEELIKAGANFASSPKRINIHALDPAVIATKMSLSDINKLIDLKDILENTKYGKDGIGGIITKGTMYVGYPR